MRVEVGLQALPLPGLLVERIIEQEVLDARLGVDLGPLPVRAVDLLERVVARDSLPDVAARFFSRSERAALAATEIRASEVG